MDRLMTISVSAPAIPRVLKGDLLTINTLPVIYIAINHTVHAFFPLNHFKEVLNPPPGSMHHRLLACLIPNFPLVLNFYPGAEPTTRFHAPSLACLPSAKLSLRPEFSTRFHAPSLACLPSPKLPISPKLLPRFHAPSLACLPSAKLSLRPEFSTRFHAPSRACLPSPKLPISPKLLPQVLNLPPGSMHHRLLACRC